MIDFIRYAMEDMIQENITILYISSIVKLVIHIIITIVKRASDTKSDALFM
jgi:hypothetical protein